MVLVFRVFSVVLFAVAQLLHEPRWGVTQVDGHRFCTMLLNELLHTARDQGGAAHSH